MGNIESMPELVALMRKMRKMRDEAFAADPLLGLALAKARERRPDIGWLDVAAAREKASKGEAAS